jgi:hypothetical protein
VTPLKNTCRINVGRLLEIDVAAGYQRVEDVDEMIGMIGQSLATIPEPGRGVIAADWRHCKLFTKDVADRAATMLSATNRRVERSGILLRPDQATSVLQVFRLVKEAQSDHRRLFLDAHELIAWLSEVLDERERERLNAFVFQTRSAP